MSFKIQVMALVLSEFSFKDLLRIRVQKFSSIEGKHFKIPAWSSTSLPDKDSNTCCSPQFFVTNFCLLSPHLAMKYRLSKIISKFRTS
jgi:hypothetical protein